MQKKGKSGAGAFQLKIELNEIEPEIWRRVIVPASLTLRELHAVLQGVMGWQDYHLHMFEIDNRYFEIPDIENGLEEGHEDERNQTLSSILRKDLEFLYLYDYGDGWSHIITVEDTIIPIPNRFPVYCAAGQRGCPPEDCGGAHRYAEFLKKLTDSQHPAHQEMIAWARGFEPEAFNITQANRLIELMCVLYRERGWGFQKLL